MSLTTFKKILFVLAGFTLIISIIVVWRYETKGFRPHKIIGNIPFADFEIETSIEDENEALSILDKKFKYLNQGSQAYVFEAEDGSYVLKLIALNKYLEPFRRKLLSPLPFFDKYRKGRIINRERNFKAALLSYKIVYENLKKETGTIYAHFKPNKRFLKKIKLKDHLGMSYEIDPNKTLFIIQKKASMIIKPYFLHCSKNNDLSDVKKIISDYLDLSDAVLNKGFINRDSCVKNSGICTDGFIEIDIGRFQKTVNSKENYSNYLQKYTRLYRKFLEDNIPSIVGYFDEKTAKLREKNGLP
jgi:hypothetical protein